MCTYNTSNQHGDKVVAVRPKRVLAPKPTKNATIRRGIVSRAPGGNVQKVKVEQHGLQHGAGSKTTNTNTNSANGIRAFLMIMAHAISCGHDCGQASCKKMKVVITHYVATCEKLSRGQDCRMCVQLEAIVKRGHVCPNKQRDSGIKCRVPMCDLITAKAGMRQRQSSQTQPIVADNHSVYIPVTE